MLRIKLLWLSALIGLLTPAFPQTATDSLNQRASGKYLRMFSSIGYSSLRDKGNSALFYNGLLVESGASLFKVYPNKEFELGVLLGQGLLSTYKNSMVYAQSTSSVSIFAYKLWTIRPLSTKNWQIKAGPGIQTRITTRVNPELFNAYRTIENFSTLDLHVKAERNFVLPAKEGKFLGIFRHKRPERLYKLSYHFTGAVLPFSYRPGFVYVPNVTVPRADYFENHQAYFGGLDLTSEIVLTRYLSNGNAIQFGYQWDLVRSSPQESRFEMATHSLKVGLLFNYKK